jgi:hypothetical protein
VSPNVGPILPGSKKVNNEPTEWLFRVRRGRTGSLIDVHRFKTREAAESARSSIHSA